LNTIEQIRAKLDSLLPMQLVIEDDSAKHAGHAGAASGGGHFRLKIVSERFSGLNAVARHRLIYQTLGDMMHKQIHALAIDARAPEEN
jgi:BolA protein